MKKLKTLLTCLIGTLLEWYDFSLFAALAPILSQLFFPSTNHTAGLLATFITFAAGFLARPLGALYFGNLGDKIGRKSSLFVTVILMTFATVSMGFLPTYQQAGIIAPILLVLLRLLQGFAVSGEYSGVMTFLSEWAQPAEKGLISSFAITGAAGGMVLGTSMSLGLSHFLSHADLFNWGWRLPFIASIILGTVGWYIRMKLMESPAFLMLLKQQGIRRIPLLDLLQSHFISVLKTIGLFAANLVLFYTVFVFMPASLAATKHIPLNKVLAINLFSLFLKMFLIPLFGYISDQWGKRRVLTTGALAILIFTYPLFSLYQSTSSMTILLVQVSFAILSSWYCAGVPAIVSGLFPTSLRFSGIGAGSNLAACLLGGTAPVVAAYFMQHSHSHSYSLIAIYVLLSAVLSLVVSIFVKIT